MTMSVTLEQYEIIRIDAIAARVIFAVSHSSGRYREEILGLATIETRMRLWEENVQRDHSLLWRDQAGHRNYRQYVEALVTTRKAITPMACPD